MSLVPMLYSSWWQDLDRPHSIFDQDFGTVFDHQDHLLTPRRRADSLFYHHPERRLAAYYRPWAELMRAENEGGSSTVTQDKDQFQVQLDVQQFAPEELKLTVVGNCVQIEGKHEEKRDEHGWISRQFSRRYMIPEQCDIGHVASKLSSDGVLTITAPRKQQPGIENEKVIQIEQTGKPAVKAKPAEKHVAETSEKVEKKSASKK